MFCQPRNKPLSQCIVDIYIYTSICVDLTSYGWIMTIIILWMSEFCVVLFFSALGSLNICISYIGIRDCFHLKILELCTYCTLYLIVSPNHSRLSKTGPCVPSKTTKLFKNKTHIFANHIINIWTSDKDPTTHYYIHKTTQLQMVMKFSLNFRGLSPVVKNISLRF